MGDPISNNNRTSSQPPSARPASAASSSAGNNASNSRNIALLDAPSTRQPPRTVYVDSTQKADHAGLMSFLQEFPSLDELHRKFPEFGQMTLPDQIDGDGVADFARVLRSVLGRRRCEALTRTHAPKDILRGLAELRARGEGKRAASKPCTGKDEAAERPEEPQRTASVPRPRGATLPHYLLDRQIGLPPRHAGDDLQSRLSGVRHDQFASIAILANCDVDKLGRYHERISRLLESIEAKHPRRWESISSRLTPSKSTRARILSDTKYYTGCVVSSLCVPLLIEKKKREFFYDLSCLECTVRILQEASGNMGTGISTEAGDERWETLVRAIAAKASGEILLSMLLVERNAPEFRGRNAFERTLIASLMVLYDTRDLRKAGQAFESGARTFRLERPRHGNASSDSGTNRPGAATEYVRRTLDYFSNCGSGFEEFNEKDSLVMTALLEQIAYHYCMFAEGQPGAAIHLAAALRLLFSCTGLQRQS